jgi:hypothetical protein
MVSDELIFVTEFWYCTDAIVSGRLKSMDVYVYTGWVNVQVKWFVHEVKFLGNLGAWRAEEQEHIRNEDYVDQLTPPERRSKHMTILVTGVGAHHQ